MNHRPTADYVKAAAFGIVTAVISGGVGFGQAVTSEDARRMARDEAEREAERVEDKVATEIDSLRREIQMESRHTQRSIELLLRERGIEPPSREGPE